MMDSMFDDMMMMPFGSPGGSRRGGAMMRGGGLGGGGGGIFGLLDEMMAASMAGPCGGGGGGNSMMAMGGAGDPSQGSFSCQSMCMSMSMGPDGQVHTERFASSTIGDNERRIRETQQAYSNSSSGVDKMSLERQMDQRGRKVVKERSRFTGEEKETSMLRGIDESQTGEFDRQWQQQAQPHLPQHYNGPMQLSLGGAPGAMRGQQPQLASASYPQSRPLSSQYALPPPTSTQPAYQTQWQQQQQRPASSGSYQWRY